jgi:hypothetical protein
MLLMAVQEGLQQPAHGLEVITRAQCPPALPPQALAAQFGPDRSEEGTAKLWDVVHSKREPPQRGPHHGKMLLAMSGGLRAVVALIFQRLACLIGHLPPRMS